MIREKTVATRTLSTPRLDAPKSKNVRNFGEHVTLWHVKHCWHWCGIVDKVHHPSGLVKYYTCLLCFGGNMERFFVGAAGVILGPKSHSWEYKSNIVGWSLGWFLTKVSILHVQRLFWLVYWKTGHSFFEAAIRSCTFCFNFQGIGIQSLYTSWRKLRKSAMEMESSRPNKKWSLAWSFTRIWYEDETRTLDSQAKSL